MFPKKKIKSYEDLYPTVKKDYGITTRKSENFHVNIGLLTFLSAMPPLLITTALTMYRHIGHESRTDVANHTLLFVIVFILTGVFTLVFLGRARALLRRDVVNLGFLSTMYLLAFLPVSLATANVVIQSGTAVGGVHYYVVAGVSIVIIMFLFSLVARVTNAGR